MVLPLDVWQKVFSNLNLRDLRICTLVYKLWNSAIQSDSRECRFLWYQLYQRDFDVLVGNFDFNQKTDYKSFYKSLFFSQNQTLINPLIQQAKKDLANTQSIAEISLDQTIEHYKKALENLERAQKIQENQKGDTTGLQIVIANLRKKVFLKCINNAKLYIHSEEAIKKFHEVIQLYREKEDPFSCWENFIKTEKEELPIHLLYLTAALCEHRKDHLQAALYYFALATTRYQSSVCLANCLEKTKVLIKTAPKDKFWNYIYFLENLKRNCLFELRQKINDHLLLETLEKWILDKDAISMEFENSLKLMLKQFENSTNEKQKSLTCFICFNDQEKDITQWLKDILIPHIQQINIDPFVSFINLGPGQEVKEFQQYIRTADFVIIVCTPGLKKRCDDAVGNPEGVVQEIRLAQGRYNDGDKRHTIFPVYPKGDRKSSCPSYFFEPILEITLPLCESPINFYIDRDPDKVSYYCNIFDLLVAMLKKFPADAEKFRNHFVQNIQDTQDKNLAQVKEVKKNLTDKTSMQMDQSPEKIAKAKEEKPPQLIDRKKENIIEVKASQKTPSFFQSGVTVGRDINLGNQANAQVVHNNLNLYMDHSIGNQNVTNNVNSNSSQFVSQLAKSQKNELKERYRRNHSIQLFSINTMGLVDCDIDLHLINNSNQITEKEKLYNILEQNEKSLFLLAIDLNNLEDIGNTEEPTSSLEKLFYRQAFRNKEVSLRYLILGKEGIGKSTFCKRIAFMWAQGLWNEHFDWVFLLSLREFKNKNCADLIDFIYQKWFFPGIVKDEFTELWNAEIASSKKVLFLIDDDENLASTLALSKFLEFHLSAHVLITLSPDSVFKLKGCKKFEINGFNSKHIKKFINLSFEGESPEKKDSFLRFLRQNPAILSIAHIPIQLDMLCNFWKNDRSLDGTISSLTTLYHALEIFLLRSHTNLSKQETTENQGNPLIYFLSYLAFSSIEHSNGIISNQLLKKAKEETIKIFPDYKELLNDALSTKILKQIESTEEYYFIHTTFRDYYAARYLVLLLKNPEMKTKANDFILGNKIDRRIQSIFGFAAGLCYLHGSVLAKNERYSLTNEFFQIFSSAPKELTGFYDELLAVRLLEEGGLLDSVATEKLNERIQKLIIPPPDFCNKDHPFYYISPVFVLSSCYAKKFCIPQYLKCLKNGSENNKINTCKALYNLVNVEKKSVSELVLIFQNNDNQKIKNLIFKFLLQLEHLESMDSSEFMAFCICYPPEKFIEQWINAHLNLSNFLNLCFKHQFFEKNSLNTSKVLESILRLSLHEECILYIDQKKLKMEYKINKNDSTSKSKAFPSKGICSDACVQTLERLREMREKIIDDQIRKPTQIIESSTPNEKLSSNAFSSFQTVFKELQDFVSPYIDLKFVIKDKD